MSERQTALHAAHERLEARFTDFGGWSMPVRYASDTAEHHAVRRGAGIFDLSHMGEVEVTGPQAGAFLDHALVGVLSGIGVGRAKYSVIVDEDGRVLDDLITYRLGEDRYLVVPNAGNQDTVVEALQQRAEGFDVTVQNQGPETSLIAVQGPRALEVLRATGLDPAEEVAGLKYYACAVARCGGVDVLAARTGYTGEDGFELFLPAASTAEAGDRGSAVWNTMLSAADEAGVELTLCGLASRDSLRLEAGMPLYGNELDTGHQPHASGVGFAVPASKEADFVGRSALVGRDDVEEVLVGLQGAGRRAARHGYAVLDESGERVGEVTSGAPSPTLGHPIALARVRRDVAAEGTSLQVDLRGRGEPFTVVATPFYRRER